ncbi:hypothetical protein K458DRAFT_106796 [Lentithecium fluviatile CBS 122367]|uniref:Uncharacterized protein n=1 Tax=Lentithecium fluviatile CBS 122367 TaxID=1168545 RepID=A0A6G1JJX6_9PLEO|nr:hypothetical protein K458DRAFT_106796 [Lentithecium fluviatile CBS 122367]
MRVANCMHLLRSARRVLSGWSVSYTRRLPLYSVEHVLKSSIVATVAALDHFRLLIQQLNPVTRLPDLPTLLKFTNYLLRSAKRKRKKPSS